MAGSDGVGDGVMRPACPSRPVAYRLRCFRRRGGRFSRSHRSGCRLPLCLHPCAQGQQEVTTVAVCVCLTAGHRVSRRTASRAYLHPVFCYTFSMHGRCPLTAVMVLESILQLPTVKVSVGGISAVFIAIIHLLLLPRLAHLPQRTATV